jgi:hypothetical protein
MTENDKYFASEFWVLSVLNRIGAKASLALGNIKSADIVVQLTDGTLRTIDVKSRANPSDWSADSIELPGRPNHFVVLVCFEGKIEQLEEIPSAWVIPAHKIGIFIKTVKKRKVISRALIMHKGNQYRFRWDLITEK